MAHTSVTPPRRILIVRLGAIGDVVNALTLASALKRQNPTVHVGWLTHPLAEPLLRDNPCVDRVHSLPRKGMLGALPSLRRELRGERYDLVIDLQRLLKSAVLSRLAGAPRVLGYDRARSKEGSWILYGERIAPGPPRAHMVEQYAEFARHLGFQGPVRHPLPPIPQAVLQQVEEWLQPLGEDSPIVVHIGASKPQNRWEPARYAGLIEGLLAEHRGGIVLTGGPGDGADAAPTRQRMAGEPRFVDLLGRTDLMQLIGVFQRSRLFVGCDTGPMHLAGALGLPVVALFGPADPLRTGPFGHPHLVVRQPPAKRGTPLPSATMEDVSIQDALRAVSKLAQ
ncbi:MAG: glycosyltransferase family 9 protein [Planctomycetota bacterium]|nr:glycosyltransferase family 9 protein [Planctomycetota bacterium]